MSEAERLAGMLEILKDLPSEKLPAYIEIIKTFFPDFDISDSAKLLRKLKLKEKRPSNMRNQFSYGDTEFDQHRANELTDMFGKHALSNLKNVFIIYCLVNMKSGHKRAEVLELLNLARLPTHAEALNVTLNRLKKKKCVDWITEERPQILNIPLNGKRFLEKQRSNFRPREKDEFDKAVLLVSDKLKRLG